MSASGYEDLVRELQQAAEEYDRGHGVLHAAAANAIIHLSTLLQNVGSAQDAQCRACGDDETVARRLAIVFHGDDVEWKGFITKAHHFMSLAIDTQSAARTPAEGERQRDYDHGYGVGYEHGVKEGEKENARLLGLVESVRRKAQEKSDFWHAQAAKDEAGGGTRAEHYAVVGSQFQDIASLTSTERTVPANDCRDPSSCDRHSECMYLGCSAYTSTVRGSDAQT